MPPTARVRPFLLLAALGLCLAGSACSPTSGQPTPTAAKEAEPDAIAVGVTAVTRQAVSSLYSSSATLRPDKQATVTARTRGVIEQLTAEEGDLVSAGEPLVILENDEQRIAAEQAASKRDEAEREVERQAALVQAQLASTQIHETAKRTAEQVAHDAAIAELNLARTVVRAPFSGRVLRRHVDVGATVADGTAVYDLADLDPLHADVNVPERHVGQMSVGQVVRVTADATTETVDARVERIAPSVNAATGTVKVTLAISGKPSLRPGTFVRVHVVTETHPDALVVPRSALVAEGRRWHAFRLRADGEHVDVLDVTPGFEEGDRVEIAVSQPALTDGDRIVTSGAAALTDGARVRVIAADNAKDAAARPAGDGPS